MKKIAFFVLICCFVVIDSQAQDLQGLWRGHFLSASGAIPKDATFRWDAENNWGIYFEDGITWTDFSTELNIIGDYNYLSGTYWVEDKDEVQNWGRFEFSGSFDITTQEMQWQPYRWLEGTISTLGRTTMRSLTYSQEGNYEYLRGRWVTKDGYVGVMEYRRDY